MTFILELFRAFRNYLIGYGKSKENARKFRPNPSLKLLDQVREVLRYHHYAYRTEQTYCQWILRYFYYFGGKTHPNTLGAKDVERFLSYLAAEKMVSASTQRQALNACPWPPTDQYDRVAKKGTAKFSFPPATAPQVPVQ